MATKEESRYRSSTWWDVKQYCLEVGKAHNGYCMVQMSPNVTDRTGKAFSVTLAWYPKGREASEGYLVGVSEMWPHIDFKVLPDMLMKMCFNLDFKLTEREVEAKRKAFF